MFGVIEKPTTMFRECLGLFGVFAWFFCSMYSYEETLFGSNVYIPVFLAVLFFSMLFFGLYCGRDVERLSRFAWALTPVGIVCTAVMYLLPLPGFLVLYMASGAFMGPVLLRRIYGAVEAGGEKLRFRCYFLAIALTVVFQSIWAILPLDYAVKFPVIAVLAGLGWLGVRRSLPKPEYIELSVPPRGAGAGARQVVVAIVALVLWFVVDYLFTIIHTYFVLVGFESYLMFWFGGTILPAIGFFLFAWLFDRQHERGAFLFGMILALLGLILALVQGDSVIATPLLITNGLGGVFTEFIIIAASVYLYRNSRRPSLAAAGGFVIFVVVSAISWIGDVLFGWLGPEGESTDPGLVFLFIGPAAVATLAFIAAGLYLMDRQREKNIVLALYKFYSHGSVVSDGGAMESGTAAAPAPVLPPTGEALTEAGFSQAEREIALLLIEGETRRDIARRLHMTTTEMNAQILSIRGKVSGEGELDPAIAAIVKKYRLTRRERDMLSCLRQSMTNVEIAAELFLSEETVRTHVRNLMRKLPVETRQDICAWIETFPKNPE